MPTSPDGILEATFDPARAAVALVVDGGMWPTPGVKRTNLIANPSSEVTSSFTVLANCTGARITTDAYSGTACTELTTSSGGGISAGTPGNASGAAVVAGQTYTAMAAFKHVTGTGRATSILFYWYTAAGAFISNTSAAEGAVGTSTTGWQLGAATATAPANAAFAAVRVFFSSAAAGQVFRADAALLETASTNDGTYFDGDTPDAEPTVYSWTGTPHASTSIKEWVADVPSRITVTRTPVGEATVEVRGLVRRRVEGGWYIGSDHEMPLDTDVTYTVRGYDQLDRGGTATVTVSTNGAKWGLWLKAPGRGDLTVRVPWRERGDIQSNTQGGMYPVHGGPEVSAWSGVAADRLSIGLSTHTPGEEAALRRLLSTNRTLLIQTGQPAELGTGSDWWFVESWTDGNPTNKRNDIQALRHHTLQIVRTTVPAGQGVVSTGVTYSTVYAQYPTYQALLDGNDTYADLMTGGGS